MADHVLKEDLLMTIGLRDDHSMRDYGSKIIPLKLFHVAEILDEAMYDRYLWSWVPWLTPTRPTFADPSVLTANLLSLIKPMNNRNIVDTTIPLSMTI
jgi:hypothetical protein